MSNQSILVVDDNPDNLKLTQVLLECEGFEVRMAEDARQTLEALQTYRPMLILMDVQMPEMDGLELTRKLRLDPALGDVIIVALTAYAMKGDQENARAAGCDGYIAKPVDPQGLAAEVAAYLEQGRLKTA